MAEFSVHGNSPEALASKSLSDRAEGWNVTWNKELLYKEFNLLREIKFSFNNRFGHPENRWPCIQDALQEMSDGSP